LKKPFVYKLVSLLLSPSKQNIEGQKDEVAYTETKIERKADKT
jgi:hypothetical protein